MPDLNMDRRSVVKQALAKAAEGVGKFGAKREPEVDASGMPNFMDEDEFFFDEPEQPDLPEEGFTLEEIIRRLTQGR